MKKMSDSEFCVFVIGTVDIVLIGGLVIAPNRGPARNSAPVSARSDQRDFVSKPLAAEYRPAPTPITLG